MIKNQKRGAIAKTESLELLTLNVPNRLQARVQNPTSISDDDLSRMYLLMREYYADISEAQFRHDLSGKTDVILLRDLSGDIRGFSTLLVAESSGTYGKVQTVFSGDTVISKEYWGQKELGVAFLKYLFFVKLRNPLQPVYWMLMSKGYKTYLLMANNFGTHYPRYEKATPAPIQTLLNDFYSARFGLSYSRSTGLIQPFGPTCKLREGVAAVTEDLIARLPRVAFFSKKNPTWDQGVELACVAEMTLSMPFYYLLKKTILKRFLGAKR